MNVNKIFILGNMVADPENRMLPSGRPVTNFRVATNRVWNDESGNRHEAAEFHRIVAFGKLADIAARYLAKGQIVFVEGRIQTRSWQAQDGIKRYQTEIVADGLQLGPRTSAQPRDARPAGVAAGEQWPAEPTAARTSSTPPARNDQPARAESVITEEVIPVVNLEDEEELPPENPNEKIKPEDLPF